MKLKKLLASALAGVLTLSSTLVFTPAVGAEDSVEFDPSKYSSSILFETTELTSNQTMDFEINDERLPKDKGKNGDLIQITYTEAGSTANYLTLKFEALAPKTTSGEDVVSTKEYKSAQANKGKVIVHRFSFYEDLLAPAKHTANTGTKDENATEAVTKIRLTFGTRMNFANKTVKIEVLTPKSADDSSKDDSTGPNEDGYYTIFKEERTFPSTSMSDAYNLYISEHPELKGEKGEILKVTATDNGASAGIAVSVKLRAPKLDGSGQLYNVKPYKDITSTGESGTALEQKINLAEWVASAIHQSKTTGVVNESASDVVAAVQIYMGGGIVVPDGRIQDKKVTIEILAPKSADDSSKDDSSSTDTQSGTVYYQTKDNGAAIRFIDEVSIEAAKAATTATEETLTARNDTPNEFKSNGVKTITKAYKSIVANGTVKNAADGKCFLISSQVTNLAGGDKVKAVFTLDEAKDNKEVAIKGSEESSKPDESSKDDSSKDDSSSEADPSGVITKTLWSGSTDLKNWGTELQVGDNLNFWSVGTELTINFTQTSTNEETVVQLAGKVGSDWTWTNAYESQKIPAGSTSYTFKLTEADMKILGTADCKAIVMKGQNAIMKSVTVKGTYSAPKENDWTDNGDGTYTFYWTKANGKPTVPTEFAPLNIPIKDYDYSSITKISIEFESNDYANGAFGVAQGESTNYAWKSATFDFSGKGTQTVDLEVEGVSNGNSIEVKVFWVNKGTILNIKSVTITGNKLS